MIDPADDEMAPVLEEMQPYAAEAGD